MGKGTIGNKRNYITKTGYYLSHDFDVKVGGEFYFLLEPLIGNDDERFFCVREHNGLYEVEGEFYIISASNKESLQRHKRELKAELTGKHIWYYHEDENGNTVWKEKSEEVIGGKNAKP